MKYIRGTPSLERLEDALRSRRAVRLERAERDEILGRNGCAHVGVSDRYRRQKIGSISIPTTK